MMLLLFLSLYGGLYLWGTSLSHFSVSYSPVLLDQEGKLLGTRISSDEQWRLPWWGGELPDKYRTALLEFEDKRFDYHPGVDFLALVRAIITNVHRGEVVSGASTLTMQLMRMRADNPPRTFRRKGLEALQALAIERALSKEQILQLYASVAPMGGNTVGLQAASWRYFGRPPENLSWGESAMLAVLPNNPSAIHPGRHPKLLQDKRDALLAKLQQKGILDTMEYQLAVAEPLPQRILSLPSDGLHYLQYRELQGKELQSVYSSSLDRKLQQRLQQELNRWHHQLSMMQIHSLGAAIYDNQKQQFVAWCGNATTSADLPDRWVDMVVAPRSSGSILKPFLYGRMFESGELYPQTLVKDVPLSFRGFTPENYDRTYRGAVPATEALARSLNVPAVDLLRKHGVDRFYVWLKQQGISTLFRPADQYGLSLILGGAEVRLDEVMQLYSSMAWSLSNPDSAKIASMNPAAVWQVFHAMTGVRRPGIESWWKNFSSSRKLAWKTGTSIGHRDAWAVGVTPRYTIGILAGNADGFGRPEITGTTAAGPLLFRVLDFLPREEAFQQPIEQFQDAIVCKLSGYPAGRDCEQRDTILIPFSAKQLPPCPFHQVIHLDSTRSYRVKADCYPVSAMKHEKRFILPPAMAWYYKNSHSEYKGLPKWHSSCANHSLDKNAMSFIYPNQNNLKIWLPRDDEEQRNPVVFRVAHADPAMTLFWHLDNVYLGHTKTFHQFPVRGDAGWHTISVVDQQGNSIEKRFEFIHGK